MLLLSGILDIEPIRHRSGGSDPRDLRRNCRLGWVMNAMKRCRIPAAIDREGRRARGRRAIGSVAAAASDSCRRAFHRPIRAHARQAQSTAFGALPTLPCRVTTTKFGRSWSLSHPFSPNRLTPAVSLNSAVAAADPSLHPSNISSHRYPAHSRSSRSEPPTSHRPFVTHSLDRRRFPRSTASRPSVHHLHPSAGVYPPGLSSRPFLAMK